MSVLRIREDGRNLAMACQFYLEKVSSGVYRVMNSAGNKVGLVVGSDGCWAARNRGVDLGFFGSSNAAKRAVGLAEVER